MAAAAEAAVVAVAEEAVVVAAAASRPAVEVALGEEDFKAQEAAGPFKAAVAVGTAVVRDRPSAKRPP